MISHTLLPPHRVPKTSRNYKKQNKKHPKDNAEEVPGPTTPIECSSVKETDILMTIILVRMPLKSYTDNRKPFLNDVGNYNDKATKKLLQGFPEKQQSDLESGPQGCQHQKEKLPPNLQTKPSGFQLH